MGCLAQDPNTSCLPFSESLLYPVWEAGSNASSLQGQSWNRHMYSRRQHFPAHHSHHAEDCWHPSTEGMCQATQLPLYLVVFLEHRSLTVSNNRLKARS